MAPVRSTQPGPDVMHTDDWGDVPEQFGPRRTLLQPGPYVFKLPKLAQLKDALGTFECEEGEEGSKEKVVRIAATFRDGAELLVVQSPRGTRNGELFPTRISNQRRPRGKKHDDGSPRPLASDMDYLVKSLQEPKRPTTNDQYVQALLRHAEQDFGSDVEWSANCRKDKPVRLEVNDESAPGGVSTVVMDGTDPDFPDVQHGCGRRYYQSQLPKDEEGHYVERMTCECGAILYCNENLGNFRSVGPMQGAATPEATRK